MNDIHKEDLLSLLKKYSYKTGEFTLSSNKKSDYFIDCKKTLLRADCHWLVGVILFDEILTQFGNTTNVVGGVALGGCSLASAVSTISVTYPYNTAHQPINSLYIRKEIKTHGTQNLIEGYYEKGQKVVLLEDVITTGHSSASALDVLKNAELNPIAVISIVDRLEGGSLYINDRFGIPVMSIYTIEKFMDNK
jgi:orotate phosphoribosyltransferase